MQPVSYSPCSLAFTSTLHTLAAAQLASLLAYFFISPDFSPSLPFPPPPIVHCAVLCLTHPPTFTDTHTYYPYCLIPSLALNMFYIDWR